MTQKEKAKAYDEAIEKLRGLLEAIHEEKCDIMEEDIIKIFPELKDSEDERIRKEIIAFLIYYHTGQGNSIKFDDDWIVWLEKQSKASEVEQAIREVEEKAEAFTEAHKGETSEEILAQMRGEQKPVNFGNKDGGFVLKYRHEDGMVETETSGCFKSEMVENVRKHMEPTLANFLSFTHDHPEVKEIHYHTETTTWEKDVEKV